MKKFLSLTLVFLIMSVSNFAYAAIIEDSDYWQNIGSSYGNTLIDPNNPEKSDESFIIIYYSAGCYYSQKLLPTLAEYSKDNKIMVYAINYNESRGFMASKFTGKMVLEFPIVLVYNADTDNIFCQDAIHSQDEFESFMDTAFSQFSPTIFILIGSKEMLCGDKTIMLDVPAEIINGRTMVPLRAIAEALGASVDWDERTSTITATRGASVVTLRIGQSSITVNDTEYIIDVPPQIVNNRTLVPVRAIATGFNRSVGWHEQQ